MVTELMLLLQKDTKFSNTMMHCADQKLESKKRTKTSTRILNHSVSTLGKNVWHIIPIQTKTQLSLGEADQTVFGYTLI